MARLAKLLIFLLCAALIAARLSAEELSAKRISELAQTCAAENFDKNKFDTARVTVINAAGCAGLSLDRYDFEMCVDRPFTKGGTVVLRLNVYEGTQLYKAVPVYVKLELFKTGFVAARDLAKGSAVSEADLSLKPLDEKTLALGAVSDPREIVKVELQRPLRAGEPLLRSALRPRYDVRSGQTVQAEASTKNIAVITEALALVNGRTGEKIAVRFIGANRKALVLGPGLVQLLPEAGR